MKKVKYITIFIVLALLLVIPNASNAATEYTYSDTEQGIEWSYQLDKNNNVIELKCKTTSKTGAVTIPSTIDGKTVISLKEGKYGDGAFKDCAGITSVTIPNTITRIGEYAFYGCTGLKSITLPDSVTQIENMSFYDCTGLKSVTLSNNLTSIGDSAFKNCSGLQNLTIPNNVTTIGSSAFEGCKGLKTLTLSEGLTKIPSRAFYECSGLTSVILPDSVTTIEGEYNIYGAFSSCSNLTKILIPDSVASIGKGVFYDCKKLTIYGNDGMVSKEYAEANEIPFDYIANWDKENSGTDITAPTVESIQVTYASVMNYNKDTNKNMYMVPAGTKLVINVNFSEVIQGTTVPTLTIKFGDGQNIKLTEGTVGGSIITYIYTVKNTDKGVMTTVNLSGGDIKDSAGNVATLTCPAVSIQYNYGDFVYANGTATNLNNGNNTNNGTSDLNKKDNSTTAKGKLPQTGLSMGMTLSIILVAGVVIFAYLRYNKLRDIK